MQVSWMQLREGTWQVVIDKKVVFGFYWRSYNYGTNEFLVKNKLR